MKIIDVCEFYSEQGGGVRTYVHRKLEEGRRAGHEVLIVAPGAEDREEARLGGRIHWVASPPLPFDPRYHILSRQTAVHAVLDAEKPDLIEASSPWLGGRFVARYPKPTPRTLVFHQDAAAVYPQTLLDGVFSPPFIERMVGPYWRYLRRLSSAFDRTIVAGDWLKDRIEAYGVQRAHTVRFGIEKSLFYPERRSDTLRRSLLAQCGLGDNARLLVAVGRHHPEKRLGTLIEATRLCRNRGQDVGLLIFGDGPQRSRIERQARRAARVHVAGFARDRDALANAVASADVFVHGSSAETYGLVVAEAIACGVPVVVPHAGGAADLTRDSYGETYRPGDAMGCSQAITRMLSRDPALLRQCALHGREHVVRDVREHFSELFATYEQLIETRRQHAKDRILRARPGQGTRESDEDGSRQAA